MHDGCVTPHPSSLKGKVDDQGMSRAMRQALFQYVFRSHIGHHRVVAPEPSGARRDFVLVLFFQACTSRLLAR